MKTAIVALISVSFVLALLSVVESSRHHDDSQGKIMGGHSMNITLAPYQAAILKSDGKTIICGGALISPRAVLTAADCFLNLAPKDVKVRLGSENYQEGGVLVGVDKLIAGYIRKLTVRYYELGVVLLSNPIKQSPNIKYAVMTEREPKPNEDIVVTGWGLDPALRGGPHHILRHAIIPVVEKSICRYQYSGFLQPIKFKNPNIICAGFEGMGIGPSSEDIGCPAVTMDNKLVGIFLGGYGYSHPGYRDLFFEVRKYIPHLKKIVPDLKVEG